MSRALMRVLAAIVLITGFMFANVPNASADYWGGWKFPGSVTYPKDCLFAGTNILTGSVPNKHNAAAANSCKTDQTVLMHVQIWEVNKPDVMLDQCDGGPSTNYAQCGLSDVTGSGDYWVWVVFILTGGLYQGFTCSNKGFAYSACFQSSD